MASEDYFARLSPPQGPGIFVQPAQAPAMPKLDTGEAMIGEALKGAGAVMEDFNVRWQNAEDHVRATLAQTNFAVKANELEHGASEDPNYFVAPDKLKAGLEDLKRQQLETIRDPVRRADVDRSLTTRIIASVNHATNAARSRTISGALGAEDGLDQDTLSRWVRSQGDPLKQDQIMADRRAGIDKSVAAGIYTSHAGEQRWKKIQHETSQALTLYDTRNDPAGTAKRLEDPSYAPGLGPVERERFKDHATGQAVQAVSDGLRVQAQQGNPVVRGIVDMGTRPVEAEGLVTPGNINLLERPVVENPETGEKSTVYSMSFERDGQHILVPRANENGKILSPDQAIAEYDRTGKQLGVFKSSEEATKYAERLSKQQSALINTPEGKALMSLPPHMRYRTIEGAKTDLNQLDAAQRQEASRAAAVQRDTNDIVQLIKEGADVPNETINKVLSLQQQACVRGDNAACKYAENVQLHLQLRPHVESAWKLSPPALGVAVERVRGELTAAGADPNNAQFKALHAYEEVQKEMNRAIKEEPVVLGQKTRAFTVDQIDLDAAAKGDPYALAALRARGVQSKWANDRYGGSGTPWLKAEADQFKAQFNAAGAEGRFAILQALQRTMPNEATYNGAVDALGGDRFATSNMRNIIANQPRIASDIVRGATIRSVDKQAQEKAEAVRGELLTYVGSVYSGPEQRRQAIDLALDLDTARRASPSVNTLYDQNATGGLKKAWDDVNGPIQEVNKRRTPITPGIDPGHFTQAFARLDASDLARAGGAYARDGRALTPFEISTSAILKPVEPGSSIYYVGMRRPDAQDEFMGFFDHAGKPLKLDMADVTKQHPARDLVGTINTFGGVGGVKLPESTPQRERFPMLKASGATPEFEAAVKGDLRTQFPDETDAQIQKRFDSVNTAMGGPAGEQHIGMAAERIMQLITINPENWERFIRESPKSTNIEDRRPASAIR